MALEHEDPRELRYARGVLTGVYLELLLPTGSREETEIVLSAAGVLTPAILRGLADDVSDPWPWAPLLRRLLALPESDEARAAFERVYELAQQMLDEQGLELVRPEDLLAVGPVERHVSAYMTGLY